MDSIMIHYAEIGIKKGKRGYFENKLISEIKRKTGAPVIRNYGSLVINSVNDKILNSLRTTPGIASYSPAFKSSLTIKSLISKAEKLLVKNKTFKVITQRSNKDYKLTSMDVNKLVGEHFFNKGFKVDIHSPQQKLYIEILPKKAYVYTDKIKGVGGLPVSSSGKLLSLLSGGIDSPVASYYMIKRGCKVSFIHFHNEQSGVKEKIQELVRKLSVYQGASTLFLIPFREIQNVIIQKCPSTKRMIVYRRLMLAIACEVAKLIKAKGLVTGDSVGQVASQTLENLGVIRGVASLPVYSPLIGFDKEDIVSVAKIIGTYDLSILPYSDCCSFLVAQHPETKAELSDILKIESSINIQLLVSKGLNEKKVIKF